MILETKRWEPNDTLVLKLGAQVEPVPANNGEFYLRYGPLFYALAIPADMKAIKDYPIPGFHDYVVTPVQGAKWHYSMGELIEKAELSPFKAVVSPTAGGRYPWDTAWVKLNGTLINQDTGKPETVALVPMGCGDAKLRRCTFRASGVCARMP